ncbi:MAG: hypothetical protein M3082_16720 [Candidatus Dormibacteraeota bacterium]|nr:hypothetical protein [Candidatus Dormibacteraeota bacterium]
MPELSSLEQQLAGLTRNLEWPATPNLGPAITQRIGQHVAPRRPWFESRWAMAAAVVILATAALLAYSPSRDAIANWFNLHTRIQQVPRLATPSPAPPGPLGTRLGLGSQTTLSSASIAVAWHVLAPSNLGQPDEVYLQLPTLGPPQGEVTLVYAARTGIPTSGQTGVGVLITEARGAVNTDFFGKTLGPDATLQEVTIAGHHGYWIAGQPHVFFLIDSNGNTRDETLRLATNTLLIDFEGTIVRVEGDLTKAQALEIASSLL